MQTIKVIAGGTLGMSTYELIKLLILLLVISGIGIAVLTAHRKVKRLINSPNSSVGQIFQVLNALKQRGDIVDEAPKSVASMTRLMEPQIMRDFPEFSWDEFKAKSENMLASVFLAITANDTGRLVEASEDIKRQVANTIEENRLGGIAESYSNIQIHQTEIANYQKLNGKCVITIQSAVGYIYTKMQDGKLIDGDAEHTTQTKYNVELVYIQDMEMVGDKTSVGTTCPQCGAPIKKLGSKFCEYCGSGVIPVNIKVWSLHKYYEVDYNRV